MNKRKSSQSALGQDHVKVYRRGRGNHTKFSSKTGKVQGIARSIERLLYKTYIRMKGEG